MNYLLWWRDGGVTDLLSLGCLVTERCYRGTRFLLDLEMWRQFGRAIYYER